VFKFESGSLKEFHYNIKNISIFDARKNGELVAIADSQLVRTLHQLTNKESFQAELDELLAIKRRLNNKKNSSDNRKRLKEVNDKIDTILFIPEIISIQFEDKRHFKNIIDKGGVRVNGKNYIFFMASAGQTRRDISLFIDESLKGEIMRIFDNGRNLDTELVPAKYSAYLALYSSSSLEIPFPRIAVIKDVLIKATKKVDFSHYVSPQDEPVIQEEEKELEFNGAVGQGLMSPEFAEEIKNALDLDYLPSSAIVRAPFIKGLLVTFPIHEFAEKVSKKKTFKDIYGNTVNINDVDCIISESQFKLFSSYSNTQEYIENCQRNNLGFGVSRVSPKEDKTHARSSYQFLQVLDLDKENVEKICQPTINWIKNVSGDDISSTLLYLLGETAFEKDWFWGLDNKIQALLLENELINDSYHMGYITNSIAKKCNDAKLGKLIFSGNYQFAICDPYAQMSFVMNGNIQPLLQDGQHYSAFWNERGIQRVTCIRSPIVHSSEVDVLSLQNREDVNHWYRFLSSGIVFPLYGISLDMAVLGGADVDGDSVCTINHESFINGRVCGLPIFYESKKPNKIKINEQTNSELVLSQLNQVKSNKIGFFTNLSSTFYSLLYNFQRGSKEYETILNRLKYFRVVQGHEIDRTKGIIVDPFLSYWTEFTKITDEMTEDEKEGAEFNNSIVARKRPVFMRFLYNNYAKRYKTEIDRLDKKVFRKWHISSFQELLEMENKTDEQLELISTHNKKSYFVNNDSTMDKISRHMDRELKNVKYRRREKSKSFDYGILLSNEFVEPTKTNVEKMRLLFKEWKSYKRTLREGSGDFNKSGFFSMEQIAKHINLRAYSTISNNSKEISDLSVYLCYKVLGKQSKGFCWECFGEEIVENIKNKKQQKFVRVPLPSKTGNIEYLWNTYGNYLLNIEEGL
jgi:hypothetical protein